MSDGVKFIFKTLIKVPIIILISYFIFNIFSYTVAYFRLYSAAQMINSIVMENGYLPGDETDETTLLGQVKKYMDDNVSSNLLIPVGGNVCPGVTIETNGKSTSGSVADGNNVRVQYGGEAKVTVSGHLVWLMPLVNVKGEYLKDGVNGISTSDGTAYTGVIADAEAERERRGFKDGNDASSGVTNNKSNITFTYTVPCLKYYSDIAE